MAGKTVSVTLQAKVDGFVAGMRNAKDAVDDLTGSTEKVSRQDAFDRMSNGAAAAGGAIAVGLGVAVKKFAEFDSAMSGVAANSGASASELAKLRDAAITLGADTKFSATEAADGINELAKAGVSTSDILGGGLKGSLDLAAAGQIGVGEAAETAATAMTQFNLEGGEIPHVADLLTNAANKAQGGVGDLAQALKQGGLVAASTGLTIDETTASLAAFASAGLIGSDAGTSLKTMLQRLSAPSDEAARLMKQLGISAYDASGEFVGMEALSGQLQSSLSGLTAEQRNSALATIFGSDAVRAANILYAEGADGIAKWTTEVTEQGAAAKQAATLTDNLQGDVERLGGAFDSVFIKTGSGANSALRTLVQGLTGVVDHVGKIPGPVLLVGSALASLALVAPKAITSFRGLKTEAAALGLSMETISSRGPRAAEAMHGLDRGARAAAKGFAVLSAAKVTAETLQSDDLAVGVEKATERVLGANDAVAEMNKILEENAVKSFEADSTIRSLGDAADVAFNPSKMESFSKGNEAFWKGLTLGLVDVTTKTDEANEAFSQIDSQLAALVQGGNADEANRLFEAYADEVSKSGVSTDEFKTKLPGFTEALAAAGNQSKLAGDDMAGMGTDAQSAEDAVDGLKDAITGLGDALLGQRGTAREYQASLDEVAASIKENGRTLDINTEAGRSNEAALDSLANSTQEWAAATLEATGSTSKAQAILDQGRGKWIQFATDLGMSKTQAKALADQLFSMPAEATTEVKANTEAASKKTRDFRDLITGVDRMSATPSIQEQGATASRGRVRALTDQINGVFGKTVTVKEQGANESTARVGGLIGKINGLFGKNVDAKANVYGQPQVDGLRNSIGAMSDKTVTVTTVVRRIGANLPFAEGGFNTPIPMASGDLRPPVRPGIYGTSPQGILMAEDTRSAWEAYIPERPDLRPRAEAILEETARRFGKAVIPMASGGVTLMRSTPSPHEGRTYVAPAPRIATGSSSSASTYSGSITEAGMERAITSAFSRVKVVTTINGRDFAGTIQRTKADRKGR